MSVEVLNADDELLFDRSFELPARLRANEIATNLRRRRLWLDTRRQSDG